MKKIWLTFVAVLCFATTLTAETVSPSAARQVAAQFLKAQGATLTDNAAKPHHSRRIAAHGNAPVYYIFNADAAQGFVVVSGDDCVGDNLVLGYTKQGSFSTDNVPDNLQWWLDATAENIARLSSLNIQAPSVPTHDDIAPMVTAKWDQSFPYNVYCPVVSGRSSVTGCMATALAQVMYYHRWPQTETATLPAYTMSSGMLVKGLPSTTFNWDDMQDKYSNQSTNEQMAAVAVLMRYCGQSVQMEYTPNVSNGICYDLDLLVNAFGYDPGVYSAFADNYTVSGWDALIYNELREKRPLVYCGHSTGGGHAFVIDGYEVKDGEGYYNVNWGWDGSCDGFYKINLLNPSSSGSGGSTTKDGYCRRQQALIGLQPCLDPSRKFYRYLSGLEWNTPSIDGPKCYVLNQSYRDATFDIALVGRNSDGAPDFSDVRLTDVLELKGFSYAAILKDQSDGFIDWVLDEETKEAISSGLAPGHHNYMYVNKENGVEGALWKPIFGPNNYIEVVIGSTGQLEQMIVHPQPQLSSSSDELKLEGIKQRGLALTACATIHNASTDDYVGSVLLDMYRLEDGVLHGPVVKTQTGIMIEGSGTTQVFTNVSAPTTGDYIILLTTNEGANADGISLNEIENVPNYLAHKRESFDELEFVCKKIDYEERADEDGDSLYSIKVVLDNGTPLDYDAALFINVYKRNDADEYDAVDFPSLVYSMSHIPSYTCDTVSVSLPFALTPGDYVVELNIANDFNSRVVSSYFVFDAVPVSITSTGIIGIKNERQTDSWYDLSGRRLNKKPTQKGIYLRNDQKVLVK